MGDGRREAALRALAEAIGDCEEAGLDGIALLDEARGRRGWPPGKRAAWPAEVLEDARGLLGCAVDDARRRTPGYAAEQRDAAHAERVRKGDAARKAPPQPPWTTNWPRGRDGRPMPAAEVREMLAPGSFSPIEHPDIAEECREAMPAVEAWEAREALRRKLEPPRSARGRFPWIRAVEEHFGARLLPMLDEEHRRRGLPTRTDEWDDAQWELARIAVEDAVMRRPDYDGELGDVPDVRAIVTELYALATPVACGIHGTSEPTYDQVCGCVDAFWADANGGELPTAAWKGGRPEVTTAARLAAKWTPGEPLLPFRRALSFARSAAAEQRALAGSGGGR